MEIGGALLEGPLGGFVVTLGIGLLIGVERERSAGDGAALAPAGVRTFALVATPGVTAGTIASAALLAMLLAFTTNTVTKTLRALTTGGWTYARALVPGLVLMLIAFAAGAWLVPGA